MLIIIVLMPGVGQFVLNDPPKTKLSKFDGFCNFARKSFGSSFEHLFKVCFFVFFWVIVLFHQFMLCFVSLKFFAHFSRLVSEMQLASKCIYFPVLIGFC